MRKRRLSKVAINTTSILEIAGASLIVQKAPALLASIIPIPQSISAVAGAGLAYLAGAFFKKPLLANAGIALGLVDLATPYIDGMVGTTSTTVLTPASSSVLVPAGNSGITGIAIAPGSGSDDTRVGDFLRLNDYVRNPSIRQSADVYANSY